MSKGSLVVSYVVGVVSGLMVAALAAIFITNAPVPFINKVKRPGELVQPSADGKLPDPNKGYYAPPSANVDTTSKGAQAVMLAEQNAAQKSGGTSGTSGSTAAALPGTVEGTRYLLQAGAFKSTEEADAMRARLALLGLDGRVYPVQQGETTLYRVRIGPLAQVEEVNKARKLLADNKIEAQLLRAQ